jgi:hypothetical protein
MIFFVRCRVVFVCSLRLSDDHLQSQRSHIDSLIVHTAITRSAEDVIMYVNLRALFNTYVHVVLYWQFRLTDFSWFPLVTPDKFPCRTWNSGVRGGAVG